MFSYIDFIDLMYMVHWKYSFNAAEWHFVKKYLMADLLKNHILYYVLFIGEVVKGTYSYWSELSVVLSVILQTNPFLRMIKRDKIAVQYICNTTGYDLVWLDIESKMKKDDFNVYILYDYFKNKNMHRYIEFVLFNFMTIAIAMSISKYLYLILNPIISIPNRKHIWFEVVRRIRFYYNILYHIFRRIFKKKMCFLNKKELEWNNFIILVNQREIISKKKQISQLYKYESSDYHFKLDPLPRCS